MTNFKILGHKARVDVERAAQGLLIQAFLPSAEDGFLMFSLVSSKSFLGEELKSNWGLYGGAFRVYQHYIDGQELQPGMETDHYWIRELREIYNEPETGYGY